jgi:hypothetical protein
MIYACPTWGFAADIHLTKLERPQNKILRTTGKFRKRTRVLDLNTAFKLMHYVIT